MGKAGRGAGKKTPVFGIYKRNDKVYTEVVPDCSKAVLGLRPQAVREITIDAERRACRETGRLLTVDVGMVEPLGEQMDVHVTTSSSAAAVFRVPAHERIDQSKPFDLAVESSRLRLFEPGELGRSLAVGERHADALLSTSTGPHDVGVKEL